MAYELDENGDVVEVKHQKAKIDIESLKVELKAIDDLIEQLKAKKLELKSKIKEVEEKKKQK